MPLQEDYQLTLDAFCGPMDLLLYLIRQAEVDVHDIPVAEITDQYLKFLEQAGYIDIEAAGDFLVMAATLMEIKSRTLMPPEPAGEDADGEEGEPLSELGDGGADVALSSADPRFELVQQLLQYQRYRVASEELEEHRQVFSRQFAARVRQSDEPEVELPALELEDAHVFDLSEAYGRIISSIDFTRLGDHRIEIDDTPAVVYQQQLLDRLEAAGQGRLTLQEVFEGRERVPRIGLFLAMLELVRLRRINVRQTELDSDITVELINAETQKHRNAET